MTVSLDSQSIFTDVTKQLKGLYEMPLESKEQVKDTMDQLENVIHGLELKHGQHSQEANVLFVERAVIIGQICRWVKNSLLHGQWTEWAEKMFSESLRTLEKFMAMAKSSLAMEFAHLGTERVYQLTRVEHLLKEGTKLEDLFTDCELDTGFTNYTGKTLERAVKMILNKAALTEREITLPNSALQELTENFSLIDNNTNVIGRLCEAKSEDANLEKVIGNMVATAGSRSGGKKRTKSKSAENDLNTAAVKFLQSLQAAIQNQSSNINKERLKYIVQLISECLETHNKE